MPSLGKHGDMRFRRLPNLIHRSPGRYVPSIDFKWTFGPLDTMGLPKIGTPKNDIKLFFHVHSYSTILRLQA